MTTQINIYIVIAIIFFHWIFDCILQTDDQANNKSKSFVHLISNTITYSACWVMPICLFFGIVNNNHYVSSLQYVTASFLFGIITLCLHTLTDYYTSKLNTRLLEAKKHHDFFVSVFFDQWLHYLQLFLTFQLISDNLLK